MTPRPTLFGLFLGLSIVAAAQAPGKPAAPGSRRTPDTQLYRNTTFGFRYQIPYGWVDRTKDMREQQASSETSEQPPTPDSNANSPKQSNSPKPDSNPSKPNSKETPAQEKSPAQSTTAEKTVNPPQGEVLLAVFERPPDAPGDTINSAVVIAVENAMVYPGLKKAEDYLGPLTELASAKGFKPDGDPDVIEIDSRQLIRADFSKPLTDKLTMHQSTLILLSKGQILSFTFIAGSGDEVDDLIDGLHFGATRPNAH